MKKDILANFEEPTDADLSALMREVSKEAKDKSLLAQKKMMNKIAEEIITAQIKAKSN